MSIFMLLRQTGSGRRPFRERYKKHSNLLWWRIIYFQKFYKIQHIHIVKRRSGLGVDRCRSLKFYLPRFYNFSLLGFRTGPPDMIAFQHIFLISSFMLLRHSGSSTRPFGALQEAYQPLIVENHIFSKTWEIEYLAYKPKVVSGFCAAGTLTMVFLQW